MKLAAGPLYFAEAVPDRVMHWTENDLALMRDGIRQMENALERARADYRHAEARLHAQAC
jgi:GAF domain-containing protein